MTASYETQAPASWVKPGLFCFSCSAHERYFSLYINAFLVIGMAKISNHQGLHGIIPFFGEVTRYA